jgi:hypothetical protein
MTAPGADLHVRPVVDRASAQARPGQQDQARGQAVEQETGTGRFL